MEVVTSVMARERIMRLQEAMLALPADKQVHPAVRHFFAAGLYGREMTIPKGVVVVGKLHKCAHICTISKGRVRVYTDGGMVEIAAPHTFITQPGTKRVILALTKAVWTTYHHNPTNTEDQDKLEAINIAQSYTDLIEQE